VCEERRVADYPQLTQCDAGWKMFLCRFRLFHQMQRPPSTSSTTPVIMLASSEAR
jgi:hypothetical protein